MVMVSIGGDEVLGSAVAAVIVLDVRLTGYRGDPGNTSSKAILYRNRTVEGEGH